MLHESLWQRNQDLADQFLVHPFVHGLGDGTLDRDVFRRYVAQDAFFLRAFAKAYALAMAKCDDFPHVQEFHDLIAGVLSELTLHADYSASLDINLHDVEPLPATSTYTNFLISVAWHDSLAEIVAAMVPCLRLYAYIGMALKPSLRPGNPYQGWIETYSSDEFLQLCSKLETLLDQIGSDVAPVHNAYRYALQCELDFFSAPLADRS